MDIFELLHRALIAGGAWRAVLNGLLVTLEISVLSIILGTLIGAAVCALRMSKNNVVSAISSVYIAVLRGSPVLLLLMMMYYIIFARSSLPAPIIAVSAFALNFSAHAAECMRAALEAADPMQAEAARTLGFSKLQAFRIITLPLAVKTAKPVYQSAIVNLIQWTSVVGYVTITDLTRVINNTAMRTMQPMLMIFVGIAIYLGLAYICFGCFALSDKMSEAKRRKEGGGL